MPVAGELGQIPAQVEEVAGRLHAEIRQGRGAQVKHLAGGNFGRVQPQCPGKDVVDGSAAGALIDRTRCQLAGRSQSPPTLPQTQEFGLFGAGQCIDGPEKVFGDLRLGEGIGTDALKIAGGLGAQLNLLRVELRPNGPFQR